MSAQISSLVASPSQSKRARDKGATGAIQQASDGTPSAVHFAPGRQDVSAVAHDPSFVASIEVEYDPAYNDPDGPGVHVWSEPFVRLPDGSWASDAFVAVRRGRTGTAVYAEALHLLPAISDLPSRLRITPGLLRSFRGLPAIIVGVTRPGRSHKAVITAESRLNDRDWVSEHRAKRLLVPIDRSRRTIDEELRDLELALPAGWAFFGVSPTTLGTYEAVAWRPGFPERAMHVRGRGVDMPAALADLRSRMRAVAA